MPLPSLPATLPSDVIEEDRLFGAALRLHIHWLKAPKRGRRLSLYPREAISLWEQALNLADDAFRCQNNLNYLHQGYFVLSKEEGSRPQDLDHAITYGQNAIDIMLQARSPPYDSYILLSSVSAAFEQRFAKTRNTSDLDEAIRKTKLASYHAQKTKQADRYDGPLFARLAWLYLKWYEIFEHDADKRSSLSTAAHYAMDAYILTKGTPLCKKVFQNTTQPIHYECYLFTRRVEDLDRSILLEIGACEADSELSLSSKEEAQSFARISRHFLERYQHNATIADANTSLSFSLKALRLDTLSPDDKRMQFHLNAHSSYILYTRNKSLDQLQSAIDYMEQAIQLTTEGSIEYWAHRVKLAIIRLQTSEHHGAVEILEAALGSLSTVQYVDAVFSAEFGAAISQKHFLRIPGSIADICEAIPREKLQATGRNTAEQLLNIGTWLMYHCQYGDGDETNLRASFDALMRASASMEAPPLTRILAAKRAIKILVITKSWRGAAKVLDVLLYLLPRITHYEVPIADLGHSVLELSEITPLVVEVMVGSDASPLEFLRALEQCRGIIASLRIGANSDLTSLKEKHERLWKGYIDCLDGFTDMHRTNNLDATGSELFSLKESFRKRTMLRKKFRLVQEEIKTQPGFGEFLGLPDEDELRALARDGPIVSFAIGNRKSSWALYVDTKGVGILQLPSLKRTARRLIASLATMDNTARRTIPPIVDSDDEGDGGCSYDTLTQDLQYLWDVAVQPILDKLGLIQDHSTLRPLPRIWWVGGEELSLLPIHAAGYHTIGSTKNTYSHVISSYAPTLKVLQHTREHSKLFHDNSQEKDVLLVSMPVTPGTSGRYRPLDVTAEVAAIETLRGPQTKVVHLERPAVSETLEALRTCSIAHFATHGRVSDDSPLDTGVILGRDEEQLLTIKQLDKVSRSQAWIAYLSACSTAQIRMQRFSGEGMHLASAFQVLGFQHVIGTQWGAYDQAAAVVARRFYEFLLKGEVINNKAVATALHTAVSLLREQDSSTNTIMKWALFMHLGP